MQVLKQSRFKKLLEPLQIRRVKLRNRMVKDASQTNFSGDDGYITEAIRSHYEALARGGIGLLIVECTAIDYPLGAQERVCLRINDDKFIPEFSELTLIPFRRFSLIKKRLNVFHGKRQMPWSAGMAVWEAGGFVFLSGTEGRHPDTDEVVEGIAAQTKMALSKIKERLEEFGTALDNICHLWYYIRGPDFPNGVENDPKWIEARKARREFWLENGCPEFVEDKNPPPGTLLGISGLGQKDMLIEITVIAALPPLD